MGSTANQLEYDASEDEEMAAFLSVAHWASGHAISMTLKAVIELGVLDIMDELAGPGRELSPAEIASKIPDTKNPQAAEVLDRMLRYLASKSVVTCSVVDDGTGRVERRYGLTPFCKFLVSGAGAASCAPFFLANVVKVDMESWHEMKYTVTDGVLPFHKTHGVTKFEYLEKDPEVSKIFNDGMSSSNTMVFKRMFDNYSGFDSIKELVDIGGGVGTALNLIISKFPHIKGINFDQPHVIADAPSVPGVTHIGGDMFESVPSGDAIFMKWILHDWGDEDCLKILSNCFKALPDTGKVIVVDFVLPEVPEEEAPTQLKLYSDLCMLNYNIGGKERTQKEFESLAKKAGFSKCNVFSPLDVAVIEMIK